MEISLPNQQLEMRLAVDFDANTFACCLFQIEAQKPRIIGFASKILTQSQINYTKLEKTFASSCWAFRYYRPYLRGEKYLK